MLDKDTFKTFAKQARKVRFSKVGAKIKGQPVESPSEDLGLGPLEQLIGNWRSLPGHGWNMIALPFAGKGAEKIHYRLLCNQYNEDLDFTELGGPVPNRGIKFVDGKAEEADQFLAAVEYFQKVTQIAAADFPPSGLAGSKGDVIHEEPGLWLHMTNETTADLDIARLGSVPHGDALLGLGTSKSYPGAPKIPDISGLPIGVNDDLSNPYLAPYEHFHRNLFQNVFDPVHPNLLLRDANQNVDIVKTTELTVDTAIESAGIRNIPFIVKQADATEMKFSFYIQELAQKDKAGDPILRLQYSQLVFLDFFDSPEGAGRIRWPHVSINTLVRDDQ